MAMPCVEPQEFQDKHDAFPCTDAILPLVTGHWCMREVASAHAIVGSFVHDVFIETQYLLSNLYSHSTLVRTPYESRCKEIGQAFFVF
jgi:hypothetical protein